MTEPVDSNLLQLVTSNLDGAVAIMDSDSTLQWVNEFPPIYHHLIPVPLHRGASVFSVIPAEWQPMARNMLNNLFHLGLPISVNVNCVGPDETKLNFEVACKPIKEKHASEQLYQIEIHDITRQAIFEKKVSAVASEMTSLVENANAVIIETDSRQYIMHWNKMTTAITGYSSDEILTRRLADVLLPEEDRVEFSKALNGVLEDKPLLNYELTVFTKDNRPLSFLISATPKKNSMGKPVGITLVGQDITELTEYRKYLEIKVDERTTKLVESYREIEQQKALIEKEQTKSEQLLLNVLPKSVADELKEKGHVVPRHYPMATVLFADLAGFTKMGKGLTPDLLLYELTYIFTGFDLILERNGMEKIKTMGDGYMAVGGVPLENTSHAVDAVHAGLGMIDFVRRICKDNEKSGRPPWEVRIGLHTGELVAGVIGKNKFSYDVWGATVNIASRMESAGVPGELNISETTFQLVKDEFDCSYRGNIEVKNMDKMDMFLVRKR